MRSKSILVGVMVLGVFAVNSQQAEAVVEFKDGGTHNIDYTIENSSVWVDYLAPGMQTTVNLLNGGGITWGYDLDAFQNSRINCTGGFWSNFSTNDNSQATISGGSMAFLDAYGNSQVTMFNGSVDYNLRPRDSSQVIIFGGSMNKLITLDNSQTTMSGGSIADYLSTSDNSRVNWSGGTIEQELLLGSYVGSTAILTIYGGDFAVDGQPVGYGELYSINGGRWDSEPLRHLTGTLDNGDSIDNDFYIGYDTQIVLAPEPATLLLLGLGGLVLKKRK